MKKFLSLLSMLMMLTLFISCVSTRSTLKNVDNNAPIPHLTKDNTFILTQYSKDPKYGFDPDYPVNVFYQNTNDENLNSERYLKALAGPNGEKIRYTKLESCCPFPTKRSQMGAGFLDVYELKWDGQKAPLKLYVNIYERGYLLVPMGLTVKK